MSKRSYETKEKFFFLPFFISLFIYLIVNIWFEAVLRAREKFRLTHVSWARRAWLSRTERWAELSRIKGLFPMRTHLIQGKKLNDSLQAPPKKTTQHISGLSTSNAYKQKGRRSWWQLGFYGISQIWFISRYSALLAGWLSKWVTVL